VDGTLDVETDILFIIKDTHVLNKFNLKKELVKL